MALGIKNVYQLRFRFGDTDVPVTPENMNRFQITMALDRLLPTLYVEFKDATGFLTHLTPYDDRYNVLNVTFANDMRPEDQTEVGFRIFRRKPNSVVGYSNYVLFQGFLNVPNCFSPNYERGWAETPVSTILTEIADDMGIKSDSLNLNLGLSNAISIVQPNWTNIQFLNYLASRIQSTVGDYGFFAYVDMPEFLKVRFNFMSLTTLVSRKPKYTFVAVPEIQTRDDFPIYKYQIIDNFDLIANMGIKQQSYGYFNWDTGTYVTDTIALEDVTFTSLSNYFAYDSNSNINGLSQNYIGRTNDLLSTYAPVSTGAYYKKINSLVKMIIVSDGNTRVVPGDTIKVVFPEILQGQSLLSYQYSGYWLVERVRHSFGSVFTTEYLLTRPGFDTDKDTSFVKAQKVLT